MKISISKKWLYFLAATCLLLALAITPVMGKADAAASPLSVDTYSSCSAGQITTIQTAKANAILYVNETVSYLGSHTWDTVDSRYTTWLGAMDSTRYTTVTTDFNNIQTALGSATINYDCAPVSGCGGGTFAWVNPADSGPYTIKLCSYFFTARPTNIESQALTIIHELTHFSNLAGTTDHAYFTDADFIGTALKNLAITTPANAITNADSLAVFAVNPILGPTFTVNSTADTDNGGCDTTIDCTLREAARYAADGSTIVFAPSLSGQTIRFTDTIRISRNMTIDGSSLASSVILNGDTDNSGSGDVTLFDVWDNDVTFNSLTFTKGAGAGIPSYDAGAIQVDNTSNVTVKNSTFSNNTSNVGGGAITKSVWLMCKRSAMK